MNLRVKDRQIWGVIDFCINKKKRGRKKRKKEIVLTLNLNLFE